MHFNCLVCVFSLFQISASAVSRDNSLVCSTYLAMSSTNTFLLTVFAMGGVKLYLSTHLSSAPFITCQTDIFFSYLTNYLANCLIFLLLVICSLGSFVVEKIPLWPALVDYLLAMSISYNCVHSVCVAILLWDSL